MICDNAKKLGKMGGDKPPVYCLLACCFPVVGIFLLRQTAREQYGIEVIFWPYQNHFRFRFWMLLLYSLKQCRMLIILYRVIQWVMRFALYAAQPSSIAKQRQRSRLEQEEELQLLNNKIYQILFQNFITFIKCFNLKEITNNPYCNICYHLKLAMPKHDG